MDSPLFFPFRMDPADCFSAFRVRFSGKDCTALNDRTPGRFPCSGTAPVDEIPDGLSGEKLRILINAVKPHCKRQVGFHLELGKF